MSERSRYIRSLINSKTEKQKKGSDFENEMLNLFLCSRSCSNVMPTPKTNDGGIDITMNCQGLRCAVECKNHEKPIGRPHIQKFHSAILMEGFEKGYFISSSSFTKNAYDYVNDINKNGVLIQLCDLSWINEMQRLISKKKF